MGERTLRPALRRLVLAGCICLPAVTALAALPAFASAQTKAKLSASFSPNRLGARATLNFGFSFSAPRDEVPPPLTQIELRYPANLGIGLSGLGLATCRAKALEEEGPSGCPANSVMGYGVVLTGIVLGTTPITENAPITIFRAPDDTGRLALLFYAEGTKPVATTIIFPGLLLPAPVPFGGQVSIGIPLVPTLPGAPYISVIHLKATLGPKKVTYYEKVGGVTLAYKPRGILLPDRCHRHGFPFVADFGFSDGTHTRARTAVKCPREPKRRRGRGGKPARLRHRRARP